MTARKRTPSGCRGQVTQHWWNAGFRFVGLTGDDGWLSHTKSIVAAVLIWAILGNHWSEGLVGILVAASGGPSLLRLWIRKAG